MTSKTKGQVANQTVPAFDIIVVSENFTNGLFHHEKDLDTIVEILMEHIMLSSFLDRGLDEGVDFEGKTIEECESWVADFAMYRIEMVGESKFKKLNHITYSKDLLPFVVKGRELLNFPDPKLVPLNSKNLNRYYQELSSQVENFQGSLKKYILELFSDAGF